MKKETKELIAFGAALGTTLATGSLVGLMAGWGATALANHVFPDGMAPAQARVLNKVLGVGAWGISMVVAMETLPKFHGYFNEILDIFPTDPKEVPENG